MNSPGRMSTFLVLTWFTFIIMVFVLVMVPEEGQIFSVLPGFFVELREVVYPLFYNPSIL